MTEKIIIKPCPFCGSEVDFYSSSRPPYMKRIRCVKCSIGTDYIYSEDSDDIIDEIWNKRVEKE